MSNPFFWLGLSILLVAISLVALLTVAIFTLQELARAARSAEKLLDNLNRELPATLQDLRLTGKDLSTLTDEVSGSVQSARSVVEQVDQSLLEAKTQAQRATVTSRSLLAGANAAFRVLLGQPRRRRRRPPTRRPPISDLHDPQPSSAQPSSPQPSSAQPADSHNSSPPQPAPPPEQNLKEADETSQEIGSQSMISLESEDR
ncbi:MAG: hypothetical protein AAF703_19510 [Cyanobacteria bacterium P01_D01_bin.105]